MAKHDEQLSPELTKLIEHENETYTYKTPGAPKYGAIRRKPTANEPSFVWRPPYAHDIDRILHCPYYSRYADKTQVFSLIKNDDVTRRSLHVQLVSRIARTIGSALHLNLELIEAIALGHDMGHPAFAHSGEKYLNELYNARTGRYFYHNIQSVRVLDTIFPYNMSLQTLDGIACHNGEIELEEYHPEPLTNFADFDQMIEKCYCDRVFASRIMPATLEGAVVRISDIIAYLGKDRQDAVRTKVVESEYSFSNEGLGSLNSEIINNLVVNIIENSYGKPYIKLDKAHFEALRNSKRDNYSLIYGNAATKARLESTVKPMMADLYGQLYDDLVTGRAKSPIFTHHLRYVSNVPYAREIPYEKTEPNQLVVDYIASMTDDYFIDLHRFMFPNSNYGVEYRGYFD